LDALDGVGVEQVELQSTATTVTIAVDCQYRATAVAVLSADHQLPTQTATARILDTRYLNEQALDTASIEMLANLLRVDNRDGTRGLLDADDRAAGGNDHRLLQLDRLCGAGDGRSGQQEQGAE